MKTKEFFKKYSLIEVMDVVGVIILLGYFIKNYIFS